MDKKPRKLSKHQKLVGLYVREIFRPKNTGEWMYQMKISAKLFKAFPEEEFWFSFFKLGFKVDSLSYFLTGDGKATLSLEYKRYKDSLNKVVKTENLPTEKVGEDVVINKKPRTLFDFLNYGKKT